MSEIEKLQQAELDLEIARLTYLKNTGWEHKCDLGDSRWYWVKKLQDGRQIALSAIDAIDFQRMLSQAEQ